MSGIAAEISLVVISFALYILYHIWFFFIAGSGLRKTELDHAQKNLFDRGKVARAQFSEQICLSNDTICGIQQNRNCLLAVSFLAGTVSLLAQKVLTILLDDSQVQQIREYAVRCHFCTSASAHTPCLRTLRHCSALCVVSSTVQAHCVILYLDGIDLYTDFTASLTETRSADQQPCHQASGHPGHQLCCPHGVPHVVLASRAHVHPRGARHALVACAACQAIVGQHMCLTASCPACAVMGAVPRQLPAPFLAQAHIL